MKCEDLRLLPLGQFPKLAKYILPEDQEDSPLETSLKFMCEGQMELGVLLSQNWGESGDEESDRLILAMKSMAACYNWLNEIKYEILKYLYSK